MKKDATKPQVQSVKTEKKVVGIMIRMYCRAHHSFKTDELFCSNCRILFEYAQERIDHCPYGIKKPACERCPVHCYAPKMREEIRAVMRYAGPRMFWHHPLLTIRHLWHLCRMRSVPEADRSR